MTTLWSIIWLGIKRPPAKATYMDVKGCHKGPSGAGGTRFSWKLRNWNREAYEGKSSASYSRYSTFHYLLLYRHEKFSA